MQLRQIHWLIYALRQLVYWHLLVFCNLMKYQTLALVMSSLMQIILPFQSLEVSLINYAKATRLSLPSVTCPVAMLERYMLVAKIPAESKLFLFRPIVAGRTPRLWDSGKLSRTRLTELLREKLTLLGYPTVKFSPHSLRTRGATATALSLEKWSSASKSLGL